MSELGRILALTDEVERLVAEGRWGDASAAEAERHALLVRYADGGASERDTLGALHRRSVALLGQVGRSREALAAAAVRDFGGARAVDAYRSLADASAAQGGASHDER